ncbi:MAG: hypothetical protein E6R03_16885 [Hyphomicrobiaceae bacterium]|nr:MAG: hypothetical protein E6R03_16885 [Hyphomicrobiaceae bacterium]
MQFRTRIAVEVSIRDSFVIPVGSMIRFRYLGNHRWKVRWGYRDFNTTSHMLMLMKNGEQ